MVKLGKKVELVVVQQECALRRHMPWSQLAPQTIKQEVTVGMLDVDQGKQVVR